MITVVLEHRAGRTWLCNRSRREYEVDDRQVSKDEINNKTANLRQKKTVAQNIWQ